MADRTCLHSAGRGHHGTECRCAARFRFPVTAAVQTGSPARLIRKPDFVYVGSNTNPTGIGNTPNANYNAARSGFGGNRVRLPPVYQQISGLRLLKPPYGRITGYDMNQGTIAFQIPNGDTPPNIKAALEAAGLKDIPPTGSPSQAHLLVTKNFLFATEGSGGQAILHAYDKKTGAPIWQGTCRPARHRPFRWLTRIRASSTSFMLPAARKVVARSLWPGRRRPRRLELVAVDAAADAAVLRRRALPLAVVALGRRWRRRSRWRTAVKRGKRSMGNSQLAFVV